MFCFSVFVAMALARTHFRGHNSNRVSDRAHPTLRRENPSRLRLVGRPPSGRVDGARADRIARENRAASRLSDDDARAILAARVREQLEGGRVALLPPERRRDLVTTATRMGLRPFDANLVIAIVQDATRRGEPLDDARTTGRLKMVPSTGTRAEKARRRHREFTWAIGVTIVIAFALTVLAIRWITG